MSKKSPEPRSSSQAEANFQKVSIRLFKSLLGRPEKHRRIAKALGLTKTNDVVVHEGRPTILGMVRKISHLLIVEVA